MASNRQHAKTRSGAKNPSLLAGKIVTDAGVILTPTHAQTHGRRYRYYVERRLKEMSANCKRPIRIPAAEIEASVCRELATYLENPRLMDVLELTQAPQESQRSLREKAQDIANRLKAETMQRGTKSLIMELVKTITLLPKAKGYTLTIDLSVLAAQLELPDRLKLCEATIAVDLELKVCNNGKKIIIGNKPVQAPQPNPALINAVKLAHQIKQQYLGTDGKSLTNIAQSMNMNKRLVWKNFKLAFLAPDIQLAILTGTQPHGLCLQDLLRTDFPNEWSAQRNRFGFV